MLFLSYHIDKIAFHTIEQIIYGIFQGVRRIFYSNLNKVDFWSSAGLPTVLVQGAWRSVIA